MSRRYNFHMTETAFNHLDDIIYKTALDRGPDQAEKYKAQQLAGFEQIAQDHKKMRTQHRDDLAKGTAFKVHHVEHHYVAYQSHDKHNVIIAGVFHEKMDIPTKLKELENLSRHEISALKRDIDRTNARQASATPAQGSKGGKAGDIDDDDAGAAIEAADKNEANKPAEPQKPRDDRGDIE